MWNTSVTSGTWKKAERLCLFFTPLMYIISISPVRPSVRVPRVQNSESCARSSLFANESSERETRPSIQLLAWRERALCCWDREKQFRINIFSHAAIYLYGPQQVIFALASQKYWFFIMDVFVNLVAPKFATRWRHRYIRKLDTLCVNFVSIMAPTDSGCERLSFDVQIGQSRDL